MDGLAQQGALYHHAWTTLATCTGSKSAVFTGLHNHNSGARGNVQEYVGSAAQLGADSPEWFVDVDSPYNRFRICDDVPTLVELLSRSGFYTGLQNKFHLSPHRKFPYDHWSGPSQTHRRDVKGFIAEAAELELPWMLVHVIATPHRPYPPSGASGLPVDAASVAPPAHLPDSDVVRQDWSEYLEAIQVADGHLGDVLGALDASGEADRTLVLFMGDHGPAYHRGKWTSYDLGLRVPLVLRGPGIVPGSAPSDPLSTVDLLPTLLDFLGVPTPGGLDGVSHYPRLTGSDTEPARRYAVGVAASDRSISDGRFRLVFMPQADDTVIPADNQMTEPWRNPVYDHVHANAATPGFERAYRLLDLADARLPGFRRPRFELYDGDSDPWEVDDLAARPAHAETLQRLRQALAEWMDEHADHGERP
jgi:N-sulfoglucosamine sulfohydrolase